MTKRRITKEAWVAEARARFGNDPMQWAFVCPSCGWVATIQEWKDADAMNQAAFSCIGRAIGSAKELGADRGPCNYAGGGLFRLNPVSVIEESGFERETFEFADAPKEKTP